MTSYGVVHPLSGQLIMQAGVAELVDALGLGSSDASRGGSSPSARTTIYFICKIILSKTAHML
jgi:hypothetical protein